MDRVTARTFHERNGRRFRELMREAALFASDIGKERLINISHSGSTMLGYVVTVWYWDR
jgi:hypothetical protein